MAGALARLQADNKVLRRRAGDLALQIGTMGAAHDALAFEHGKLELRHGRLEFLYMLQSVALERSMLETADWKAKVEAMERANSKDSHNSNIPSSKDKKKIPRTRSLRNRTGRPSGREVGHEGARLELVPNPDETIIHHEMPPSCDRCGADIRAAEEVETGDRRQVFGVEIKRFVTEHRNVGKTCPKCGKFHRSAFPEDVTNDTQYSTMLKAIAVYINQFDLTPYRRTSDVLDDLIGYRPSDGSIVDWTIKFSKKAEPAYKDIRDAVKQAPWVGFDESTVRVNKKDFWLHVAATPDYTWFGVHPKRGREAIDSFGILPGYKGVAVHDDMKAYWQYPCEHALCGAHELRKLTYLYETYKQPWMAALMETRRAADAAKNEAVKTGVPLSAQAIKAFRDAAQNQVMEGQRENPETLPPPGKKRRGRVKQTEPYNFLIRFTTHDDAEWKFLTNPAVPFTNNIAEQPFRMVKTAQRIAGCFRTFEGAERSCVIRSVLGTLQKQNPDANLHQIMCQMLDAKEPPSLDALIQMCRAAEPASGTEHRHARDPPAARPDAR
jgi:transposase